MGKPTTKDILRTIVEQNLVFDVQISSVTENVAGDWVIETCNTYHLQPGFKVTIGDITYDIVDIELNCSVTVRGEEAPDAESFTTYPVHFFHGTITQQNLEFSKMDLAAEVDAIYLYHRTPMVFLLEGYTETEYRRDSTKDRDANVRLFFMTQANFADWLTEDHHKYAIEPMRNLGECFLQILDRMRNRFDIIDSVDWKNHAKWGVIITADGYQLKEQQVLNDKFSGTELFATLPIKKNNKCEDFCIVTPTTCQPVTIVNQDIEFIASVPSGGEYQVTEFSGVQNTLEDTETIIQNILE